MQAETLRFVTKFDPSLNREEQGKAGGSMIDILQAACKALDITCTARRRGLLMVEQGRAEGVFALAITPAREAQFYLPEPLVISAYSFYGLIQSGQVTAILKKWRAIPIGSSKPD